MSIKSLFEDIADAIREKSGSSDTYTPAEMPSAIRSIPSGSSTASGVSYDNTSSGLTASNVQDAIDELSGDVSTINSDLSELTSLDTDDVISSLSAGSINVKQCRNKIVYIKGLTPAIPSANAVVTIANIKPAYRVSMTIGSAIPNASDDIAKSVRVWVSTNGDLLCTGPQSTVLGFYFSIMYELS